MVTVFSAPPDWIIKILSPAQNTTKVTGNIFHCLKAGCQRVGLIDLKIKSILTDPAGQQPIFLEEAKQLLYYWFQNFLQISNSV